MMPAALTARLRRAAVIALGLLALLPATVAAHQLTGRYESPLPLAAYLAGAAIAVALSFAIVVFRPTAPSPAGTSAAGGMAATRTVAVPTWLRLTLRAVGLLGWLWIVAQGMAGGATDADVPSLFLWTYGWVALPILSAFLAPVWEWLDPFTTLHDAGAAVVRRVGLPAWRTIPYPAVLERWPAVAALVVFVWLELVYTGARGGRPLAIVLVLYTLWTLLMMAQFGRDTWRRQGEAFTVWLGVVNRLAALAPADERATRLRVRRYGSGLLEAHWVPSDLALVAVATGAILFDGLSQTQIWFDAFGVPGLPAASVQLLLLLGGIAGLVFLVARIVGVPAMAAGLVPIALGYLIAHYFTALVFDGQRILNAVSDPFQQGWNLFGTAEWEPNEGWLPYGVVWAIELVAVVGGHVCGALMGHRVAVETAAERAGAAGAGAAPGMRAPSRRGRATAAPGPAQEARVPSAVAADLRLRQVPLAILMVFLTTLTLWSLGQGLVHHAATLTRVIVLT